jgi:vacuolar-type H+-ATPase subunit H
MALTQAELDELELIEIELALRERATPRTPNADLEGNSLDANWFDRNIPRALDAMGINKVITSRLPGANKISQKTSAAITHASPNVTLEDEVQTAGMTTANLLEVGAGAVQGFADWAGGGSFGTAVKGIARGTGEAIGAGLANLMGAEGDTMWEAFQKGNASAYEEGRQLQEELRQNPYARVGYWIGGATGAFTGPLAKLGGMAMSNARGMYTAARGVEKVPFWHGLALDTAVGGAAAAAQGYIGIAGDTPSGERSVQGANWGMLGTSLIGGVVAPGLGLTAGAMLAPLRLVKNWFNIGGFLNAVSQTWDETVYAWMRVARENEWFKPEARKILENPDLALTVTNAGGPGAVKNKMITEVTEVAKAAIDETVATAKGLTRQLGEAVENDARNSLNSAMPAIEEGAQQLRTNYNKAITEFLKRLIGRKRLSDIRLSSTKLRVLEERAKILSRGGAPETPTSQAPAAAAPAKTETVAEINARWAAQDAAAAKAAAPAATGATKRWVPSETQWGAEDYINATPAQREAYKKHVLMHLPEAEGRPAKIAEKIADSQLNQLAAAADEFGMQPTKGYKVPPVKPGRYVYDAPEASTKPAAAPAKQPPKAAGERVAAAAPKVQVLEDKVDTSYVQQVFDALADTYITVRNGRYEPQRNSLLQGEALVAAQKLCNKLNAGEFKTATMEEAMKAYTLLNTLTHEGLGGKEKHAAAQIMEKFKDTLRKNDPTGRLVPAMEDWHATHQVLASFVNAMNNYAAGRKTRVNPYGVSEKTSAAIDEIGEIFGREAEKGGIKSKFFESYRKMVGKDDDKEMTRIFQHVAKNIPTGLKSLDALRNRIFSKATSGDAWDADSIRELLFLLDTNGVLKNLPATFENFMRMPKGAIEDALRGNTAAVDEMIAIAKARGDKTFRPALRTAQHRYQLLSSKFLSKRSGVEAMLEMVPDDALRDALAVSIDILGSKFPNAERFVKMLNTKEFVEDMIQAGLVAGTLEPGSGSLVTAAVQAAGGTNLVARGAIMPTFRWWLMMKDPVPMMNALYRSGVFKSIHEARPTAIAISKLISAARQAHIANQGQPKENNAMRNMYNNTIGPGSANVQ